MKRPLMTAPLPFMNPNGSRSNAVRSRTTTTPVPAVEDGQAATSSRKQHLPKSATPNQPRLQSKSKARKSSNSREQRRQRIIESLEARQVFAAPTLSPIIDQSLLSGAPLQIALQADDADGDALTFSAISDNPNIVAEMRASTNRYLVLDIEHVSSGEPGDSDFSGQLIFQLFEDITPEITGRIIELVNSGFYDNLIFHRIIDNFVIQGGDPLGNGTGGSGVQFDDRYYADLQHTVSGLLSMAKSSDDTNDSQFFITEGPQRNLDFNHSIFGMLVGGSATDSNLGTLTGEEFRNLISNVPTDPDNGPDLDGDGTNDPDGDQDDNGLNRDEPLSPVRITKAEIKTLTNFEVLTVKAANGYTGSGTITVTVDDGNGGTTQETFTVSATPDTNDNDPFLVDPPNQITLTLNGSGVTGQLQAINVDGGTTTFNAYLANQADAGKVTISIDKTTGVLTVTPINGFAGVVNIVVMTAPFSVADHEFIEQQVADFNNNPANIDKLSIQDGYDFFARNNGIKFDTQAVPVVVTPTTPITIDLDALSDSGSSSTDNITINNNNGGNTLKFLVSGVTPGATVQLFNGATLLGQAVATGSTIEITTNNTALLTDGQHTITAHQFFTIDAGNQDRTIEFPSNLDGTMSITVDTAANISSAPVTSLVQFSTYTYNAESDDEAGNGATYNLLTAPAGMTIDPNTGLVTWLPTQPQINDGFANVEIQVTDKAGNVNTQSFTITFVPNEAPTLDAIAPQTVDEGTLFSYALVAQDQNLPGDTLTYSLVSGPANAVANPTTGVVTFTPLETDGGTTVTFTVRVTDAGGEFAERTFDLTINDTNTNPLVAPISTQTVTENQELVVTISASDNDIPADTLSYELISGPAGTTIDAGGVIRWTPDESHGGTQQTITFKVHDGAGGSTQASFLVNVTEQNQNPVLTVLTNHIIDEFQTLSFTASASDADAPAQALVYGLGNAPAGMTINASTGVITWVPTEAQGPSSFTFQVTVTDSLGGIDSETVTVMVIETNQTPFLGALNTLEASTGLTFTAQIPGSDADLPGQSLTYALDTAPAGITINPTTGLLSWNVPEGAAEGIVSITVRLTDAAGESVTREYLIQVSSLNIGNAFGLISQWTSTSVPSPQDNRPIQITTVTQTTAAALIDGQVAPVSVLGDNSANSVTSLLGGLNRLQGTNEPQIVKAMKPVIEGGAEGAVNESKSTDEKPAPKPDNDPFNFNSGTAPANNPSSPSGTIPTGTSPFGAIPKGNENQQSRRQRWLDWREHLRAAALVESAAAAEDLDLNWVSRAPQAPTSFAAESVAASAAEVKAVTQTESQPNNQAESEPLAASVGVAAIASLALRPRKSAAPVAIPVVNDEVRRKRGPRWNWF